MGRPTRSGSLLRKFELQHMEHILSIARNVTNAAWMLGVHYNTFVQLLDRAEISHMRPGTFEIHPLSRPELSLREFRRDVIRESISRLGTTGAAKELGIATKTVYDNMDQDVLKTRLERNHDIVKDPVPSTIAVRGRPRKSPRKNELPISFKNQKPDIPIRNNQKTLDNLEVSVWVDPEERDHYYNLDFPWGTYGSRTEKPTERTLHHALGFGEDL